jgi:short-subunit dehydrogenase
MSSWFPAPALQQRLSLLLWILLPVFLTVVWNSLDASPALFVYDAAAAATGKWQHSHLHNRTIWITGASSGIGASMVCLAMQAKAAHVILSSRNRDKLLQVAGNCQARMGANYSPLVTKLSIVPYDAMKENSTYVNVIVERVLTACDHHLDMVILNAGIYQNKPALMTSQQERNAILRVNYQAPVDLVEAIIQKSNWKTAATTHQRRPHVVVVASVASHGPHGLSSTYAATKAALKSYFFSLSTEEFSWLRVDVACPGATDTGLWTNNPNVPSRPTTSTSTSSKKNMMMMTSDRVAHLILTGAAGPHVLFYETWISNAPGLLYVTLAHYAPHAFHGFCHLLGYVRVPIWHHEQVDAMELPFLFQRFLAIVTGNYPPESK